MKVKLVGRLAFPDAFVAKQYQGQGPYSYRATVLIPKDDPQIAEIDKLIIAVAKEKWPAKYAEHLKRIKSEPNKYFKGDGDLKDYNGYAGNWAFSCTRNQDDGKPLVVDRKKQLITADSGLIYSGANVVVIGDIWVQDNAFGRAIRCALGAIQFHSHNDSFGGAAAPTTDGLDDLGDDEDIVDEADYAGEDDDDLA